LPFSVPLLPGEPVPIPLETVWSSVKIFLAAPALKGNVMKEPA
jgi:hypothetical protein